MILYLINAPKERKTKGKGMVLVPNNPELKEISESLIIDGALPNEINKIILDAAPDILRKPKNLKKFQLAKIRESLIIDGADNKTTNQVISATKKETKPIKEPFLKRNKPFIRIDLSQY